VRLPAADLVQVTESGQPLGQASGVTSARLQGDAALIEIGAGQYSFESLGLNRAKAMANVRHVAGRLDIYCSLRDLLAEERSKAILLEHLGPGTFESPHLNRVLDQPLDALARFAPLALTSERLQAVQQALLAL
jgi:hypothetical protein